MIKDKNWYNVLIEIRPGLIYTFDYVGGDKDSVNFKKTETEDYDEIELIFNKCEELICQYKGKELELLKKNLNRKSKQIKEIAICGADVENNLFVMPRRLLLEFIPEDLYEIYNFFNPIDFKLKFKYPKLSLSFKELK